MTPSSTHPLHHEASEKLFERSRAVIPGGVNSPVRAFNSVGGTPHLPRRLRARTCTMRTATSTLTWSARGARRFWVMRIRRWLRPVQQAAERGLSFGAASAPEAELAELVVNRIKRGDSPVLLIRCVWCPPVLRRP